MKILELFTLVFLCSLLYYIYLPSSPAIESSHSTSIITSRKLLAENATETSTTSEPGSTAFYSTETGSPSMEPTEEPTMEPTEGWYPLPSSEPIPDCDFETESVSLSTWGTIKICGIIDGDDDETYIVLEITTEPNRWCAVGFKQSISGEGAAEMNGVYAFILDGNSHTITERKMKTGDCGDLLPSTIEVLADIEDDDGRKVYVKRLMTIDADDFDNVDEEEAEQYFDFSLLSDCQDSSDFIYAQAKLAGTATMDPDSTSAPHATSGTGTGKGSISVAFAEEVACGFTSPPEDGTDNANILSILISVVSIIGAILLL